MNARPVARGGSNAPKAQHTAGPWARGELKARVHSWDIVNPQGVPIAWTAGIGRTTDSLQELDANANVLAAAPEMLVMIERYAGECGECAGVGVDIEGDDCEDCRDIRELIAKAKGE